MGVVGLGGLLQWVAGQKVENNWFSATVSNVQQRQEQSFGTVRGQPLQESKGSHLAGKFACS